MKRVIRWSASAMLRLATVLLVGSLLLCVGCGSEEVAGGDEVSFFVPPEADVGKQEDAAAGLVDVGLELVYELQSVPEVGSTDESATTPDTSEPKDICTPDCAGKECGDDGCGGFCASCPEAAPLCVNYKCMVQCIPDCTGKECGDDGCGAACGLCPENAPDCVDFKCIAPCTPVCAGKECGPDECGGDCGQCPLAAPLCEEGLCKVECIPDCAGKNCGSDGCGGECGQCTIELPVCADGVCVPDPDSCTEEGKQVFLVTESNLLLRFEPETLKLVSIGFLNCNAQWGETPYSMSVDRNSFAWVLYSDGTLWKVNTEDASCQASGFQANQQGFEIFGMGFSTDGPDTKDETLFIAGGGLWDMMFGDATLGSVNSDTLAVSTVAPFAAGSGLPELTGNRSGELWGFFPKMSPPRIAQINKDNAGILQSVLLPANMFADVQAWAFAYWGGEFYIFFKSSMASASGIWRVTPGSGQVTTEVANTGYVITGAGVSTCAPTGAP